MPPSTSMSLIEGAASLLDSEKYSDLTITTQTRSFKVHKAIVCTQSKVFAAMSDAGFRESTTSILPLEHDDPATVERMLTFLYTGEYDQGQPDSTDNDGKPFVDSILMANTLVYSIADKYDIGPLKLEAQNKFLIAVLPSLPPICQNFQDIVATVFSTTPDTDKDLRSIVTVIAARTMDMDAILESKAWKEVLESNGAIGRAILKIAHRDIVNRLEVSRLANENTERQLLDEMQSKERLEGKVEEIQKGLRDIIVHWENSADGENYMFHGLIADLEALKRRL